MAARWDGTALERRDVSYCPFLVVLPPRGSQESPQTSTSWPWGSSGTRICRQPPGGRASPTPLPPNLPQRPPGHHSSGRWPRGWHISRTKMPGLDLPIFVTLVTSHTTTKTATNLILSITTTPSHQPPDTAVSTTVTTPTTNAASSTMTAPPPTPPPASSHPHTIHTWSQKRVPVQSLGCGSQGPGLESQL